MNTDPTPLIEMRGITKRFLGVPANRGVDFRLEPGEICALLGENGAGKTTLMNILFGYYACDEGEIRIGGERVNLSSPRAAVRRGVRMIHQHFALVPSLSVLENVAVGQEDHRLGFLDWKAARKRLLELERRFGMTLDPDAKVWTLSVGEQQKVEILKALYRECRVLIMDEPTAVLVPSEVRELFAMLRTFAAQGNGVVFISHKLHEVMDISDRIVVLRNGEVTAEKQTRDTNARELAGLMVGRDWPARKERSPRAPGRPALEIVGLSATNDKGLPAVRNLDLAVREGEVLGLAGVSGNGQRELAEVLFGVRKPTAGSVRIGGAPTRPGSPTAVIAAGAARIPEDRIATGLMMDLSIAENLILENRRSAEFRRRGLLDHGRIREHAGRLIGQFGIKAAGPSTAAKSLSGGNLQKVILARELSAGPRLIVAAQPTRGLDVGAAEFIRGRMLEECGRGAAILLISEDLDEILSVSDRVAVMYEGRVVGIRAVNEITREQIGLWMSGVVP
ncbi:MAG TPA: ABC transporter ATP-binding protein [Kiritimatiellia bacterium]|nr:ABC transporter ATP-binding protein [Kiritimatiellia bacterium]HRZ12433.1 ABC transporter ATP-binding protein [Kiritimatiellia bacterium]HSA17809.1 ABC transporter ATP-binding protein [Kiritimatiellia bacterium]